MVLVRGYLEAVVGRLAELGEWEFTSVECVIDRRSSSTRLAWRRTEDFPDGWDEDEVCCAGCGVSPTSASRKEEPMQPGLKPSEV